MTSLANCPQCQQSLERIESGHYHCQSCAADFNHEIRCDVCEQQVETLKACGAVNYFCNHCRTLKSKSAVQHSYLSNN